MRRYRTVIIIALIGIVPIIAAVFAMRFILPASPPDQVQAAVPAEEVVPVPVEELQLRMVLAAGRDLPVGTLLGEEDWTKLGIEEDLVRRGHIALDDLEDAAKPYGYVVRKAIPDGMPLTWQDLVGPRQRGFLAAVLKPGMRAITIRLGAGTRHSGLVDPGDRVDVVLTAQSRDGGHHNVLSRTILEDTRVLAVDRRIGSVAGSKRETGEVERTEIVTATLEVFPEQTGLLALGEFEGELALAVRPLAASGVRSERSDITDLNALLARSAAPEPELRKTVRVIRGTEVSGETFESDESTVAFENAEIDQEL